ncbi:MAG TPA: hypothetical protein VNB29_10040 [Chthoniobacterales bacterium]|nr:hypothetical protein [Chthoniobacterales bacterium]
MRKLIPLLACLLLAAGPASRAASVNIAIDAGQLYNAIGTALPAGSLVLLVADTGNNGFGSFLPSNLAVGDYLNSDDQILYRGEVTIDGGLSITLFGGTPVPLGEGQFSNLQTGDALSIVWFPDLDSSSNTVSAGASYGEFTTTTPQNGSSMWNVPSAGSSIDLKFLTQATGGAYSEMTAYAGLVVVPEPREWALSAVGLIFILTVLRRRERIGRENDR